MGAITFDQPSKGTVMNASVALGIVNKGTGGALNCVSDNASGNGIRGESKGSGTGVYAVSVDGIGVYGTSTNGTAISGLAKVGTGTGVRGESQGSDVGVYGTSATGTALSGVALVKNGYGLRAENKVDGTGIFGISNTGTGIYGLSNTGNGIGVRGESKGGGNGVYGKSVTGNGVYGESSGGETAIYGDSSGTGTGVHAKSEMGVAVYAESLNVGTGGSIGVHATSPGVGVLAKCSGSGYGVLADSATGIGVWGQSLGSQEGVYAISASGNGIHAESSGGGNGVYARSATGVGVFGESSGNNIGVRGLSATGDGVHGESIGNGIGVYGRSATGDGVHGESFGSGYGIFAKSWTGQYAGYFEGNIRVTGQINPAGGDLAEEFDAKAQSEPGSVMVINNEGNLEPCYASYDKRVAGIVSGAEGYKPGMVLDFQDVEDESHHKNEAKKPRLTVALTGKVYCKADATQTPIEIGDMLTTSSTRGHAMKADEPTKAFGSVIGKALQPLRDGIGMIPVLVGLF